MWACVRARTCVEIRPKTEGLAVATPFKKGDNYMYACVPVHMQILYTPVQM